MDLASLLNRPLAIGNKSIENRLILAPMAGITHGPFREVVDLFGGCGLLYTGMCAARLVPAENPASSLAFHWRPEELPRLVCQIFGSEPEIMARAAMRIEEEGFFGVDINCGCSVAAIRKQGAGAALLLAPRKAAEIVRAVRKAVSIPVIVKFRTGFSQDPERAVAMARLFEENGADALIFHPRVVPDLRTRPPRREYVGMVKEAVSIPVFGNGNVFSEEICKAMLEETGCDGVALGRIVAARPWTFAAWTGKIEENQDIFKKTCLAAADSCARRFDEKTALSLFKALTPYFCANFPFGHHLGKSLRAAKSPGELRERIENFFSEAVQITRHPNPGLFE
ncbi:MAG: tRNA-dihydrouridine synthase family protein [Thermodesulfobacteriota bacterium]